ncbi:hypothetical protein MRX96_001221 [Rhipicephalus microplus]
MAQQDERLWTHATVLTEICPMTFRSTQDAYARLQQIKHILANNGADFTVPCGNENSRECDLVKDLNAWNSVKSSNQRETEGRIQRAVLLLHWLLVKHFCMTLIYLDDMAQFSDIDWFTLFCDGFSKCQRLRCFKVSTDIGDASYCQQLLTAFKSSRHFEILHFKTIRDAGNVANMAALAAVITRNLKLTLFLVDKFAVPSGHVYTALQALRRCQSLSHLSLEVTSFTADEASVLLDMLSENNGLKSLHLEGKMLPREMRMNSVAPALSNATTLVELKLVSFLMQTRDTCILAMSLVRAQTVQNLALADCMPLFSLPYAHNNAKAYNTLTLNAGTIDPYVYILQELHCLRILALDLLRFTPADQCAFLQVLAENEALKYVSFDIPYAGYPSELFRIAIQTGTANRLCCNPTAMNATEFANLPKGFTLEEVVMKFQANASNNNMPTVNARFTDRRTLNHVTDMTVCLTGGIIEVRTAKLLALFLLNTKRLKTVTLNFNAKKESSMLLLDALARNTSITTLGVENWCLSKWSAQALADIVRSSNTIHTLTYNRESRVPAKAFFSRLARSLGRNFTLISVDTFERRNNAKYRAHIQRVATRNTVFLARATRFVAELSPDKSDAEALELLASSSLLQSEVQLTSVQATDVIQQALRKLKGLEGFMKVTGVVKASVVCEESSGGRLRLDTLPADCWLAIRQYSSVADVVHNRCNRC